MNSRYSPQPSQIIPNRRLPTSSNILKIASYIKSPEDTAYQVFTTVSYSSSPRSSSKIPFFKSYSTSHINPGAIRFRQTLRKNLDCKKKLHGTSSHSLSSPTLRPKTAVKGNDLNDDLIFTVNKKTLSPLPPIKNQGKFSFMNSKQMDGLVRRNKFNFNYEISS